MHTSENLPKVKNPDTFA